ncbi:hypothetical protein [Rivularia sp. UHCC 0363]|uniref:hypothetical protein n=1 Tax=Rivularia sp. UHCC 0363 TaxID=3110244 RepID=UPI002B20F678|nr:hypothetical protein [Rivularia sp. UHCC 0363]MEA5597218.1 hypothetical protein [Rivularia sp. UHCC 0363]
MGKAVIQNCPACHVRNYQDIMVLSGHHTLYSLYMIIAKLVLFALPLLVASMLFLANPVTASPVNSTSATVHINPSDSPLHQLATLNQIDSNPILDQLGCQCASCVQAKSQLQGKLPVFNS